MCEHCVAIAEERRHYATEESIEVLEAARRRRMEIVDKLLSDPDGVNH